MLVPQNQRQYEENSIVEEAEIPVSPLAQASIKPQSTASLLSLRDMKYNTSPASLDKSTGRMLKNKTATALIICQYCD